jgi:hypothetical protein
MMRSVVILLALVFVMRPSAAPAAQPVRSAVAYEREFFVEGAGEAVATIRASCSPCDWGKKGREAAAVSVSLDGGPARTLVLVRGEEEADYAVLLGAVEAGPHVVRATQDPALSAASAGAARIGAIDVRVEPRDAESHRGLSLAPLIYARADTIGRFSDVPLLMWYETAPTPRGLRFEYSVIFSNEDGGTPADRLMATWGRTTDIEWVYRVEVDARGRILAEEFQGPEHEVRPFAGSREGRHPLLWVATTNNMMMDAGTTAIRFGPAPAGRDLRDASRETIMDDEPWMYRVMTEELGREGKIAAEPTPGDGRVRDPRDYLYIEACGEVQNAALTFEVSVGDTTRWTASDLGIAKFRIGRTGCFRAAVATSEPVPRALRVRVFEVPPDQRQPPGTAHVWLARINRVFRLDRHYHPGGSMLAWTGHAALTPADPPLEFSLRPMPWQNR